MKLLEGPCDLFIYAGLSELRTIPYLAVVLKDCLVDRTML